MKLYLKAVFTIKNIHKISAYERTHMKRNNEISLSNLLSREKPSAVTCSEFI